MITERELQLAKEALAKIRANTPLGALSRDSMSDKEKRLAMKYPKSTLAQAEDFEAAITNVHIGIHSSFDRIRWQENVGTSHLSGDRT